jgi:hypothetical protein
LAWDGVLLTVAWAGLKPWSSQSELPENLGLQVWATKFSFLFLFIHQYLPS